MRKGISVSVLAALALLLVSAPARAQGNPNRPPIFTYVSEWGVPRAQWGDMAKNNAETKAVLDPLVANGTLIGYGFFENRVHSDGGYTHGSWFQANSLANLFKAIEPAFARPGVTGPALAASKHLDYLMVSTTYGASAVTNSTGYLRVLGLQIRPGRMDDFLEAYRRYIVPVYDKLLADGTVVSYELDSEYVVENAPGRVFSAVTMRDAEALDKLRVAITEVLANNPSIGAMLESVLVPDSRNDILGRVTAMTHK